MSALRRGVALLICLCLIPSKGAALWDGSQPLPVNLQLTLLGKILSFDRTLSSRSGVVEIAVLYQGNYPASEAAKAELMRAAAGLNASGPLRLRFRPIRLESTASFPHVFSATNVHAVYVMPLRGLDVRALTRAAAADGVRTFSGVPEYVYEGVAVTVGSRQGRPAIYVSLAAAKAQGSDFSSQLLKLATVIDK